MGALDHKRAKSPVFSILFGSGDSGKPGGALLGSSPKSN
jgi:hypothetical protein